MNNLIGKNVIIFDLEIRHPIGLNGVTWNTYDKMGISVGCLFDFQVMDYKVYLDDNLPEMTKRLNSADLVVGFNIEDFDIPLLNAHAPKVKEDVKTYDILWKSRYATGMKDPKFLKGMKLDDHLLGTFGASEMKTGDGAMAPVWFQEGKLAKVINYCIADVKREAKLFHHIVKNGWVKVPNYGQLTLEQPVLE